MAFYVIENDDDKSTTLYHASDEVQRVLDDIIELDWSGDAANLLGGKSYLVGEIASDPATELRHQCRKDVLEEHGFEVDDAEIIVIKDEEWAKRIDEEINSIWLDTRNDL